MEKSESRRHRIGGATVSVKNISFCLFKYYTSYDNNSESKVFFLWKQNVENHHHILFIERFLLMNASSFLEYCGSLQEPNGWPL